MIGEVGENRQKLLQGFCASRYSLVSGSSSDPRSHSWLQRFRLLPRGSEGVLLLLCSVMENSRMTSEVQVCFFAVNVIYSFCDIEWHYFDESFSQQRPTRLSSEVGRERKCHRQLPCCICERVCQSYARDKTS